MNRLFGLLALLASTFATAAAADYKIVTASERGTYIQIGRDLAKFVAAPADINLEALPSKGSAENVKRLRYEPGVKLALVQSDVYQAYLDEAAQGNREAGAIIRPLRVLLPLYNEEIYFIVRADSPLNSIHEIQGKRINVGPVQSGTALSAATLYRLMFGGPIPESNASYLSNEDALIKLTVDKSLDVVVVVAGQPAKLFTDMKPEVKQYIKLLSLDDRAPATARALKIYFPAKINVSSYPNWLTQDVPSLAVKAYLVTYDFSLKQTRDSLVRFGRSLCENFPTLQQEGHAKWREVSLDLPRLGKGWSYYPPVERELRRCAAQGTVAESQPPRKTVCSQQEKLLGLCAAD